MSVAGETAVKPVLAPYAGALDILGLLIAFLGGIGAMFLAGWAERDAIVLLALIPIGVMLGRIRRTRKDKTPYRPLLRGMIAGTLCVVIGVACIWFGTGSWPLLFIFLIGRITDTFV